MIEAERRDLLTDGGPARSDDSRLRPIQADFALQAERDHRRLAKALVVATWIVVGLLIVTGYLWDLGRLPDGFFCDEAAIGLESQRLAAQLIPRMQFPLFYSHLGFFLGALPIYAAAPFVWLLGLSEFSVRLVSVAFVLATCALLYWILHKLDPRSAKPAVLLFALTPVVIHINRINFGHSASLFFLLLGFSLLVVAEQKNNLAVGIAGGLAIGVSAYGHPSFLVVTPLFVFSLCVAEVIFHRSRLARYRPLLVVVIVAGLCYLPIIYQACTNPGFWTRLNSKSAGDTSLTSTVFRVITNYPKYYSYNYLFSAGEVGPPELPVVRDSVQGAGLLSPLAIPLIVAGLAGFLVRSGDSTKRFFLPFALLFLLYPVPDLLTTRSGYPPYTLSVYPSILWVPFIAAFGLRSIERFASSKMRAGLALSIARRLPGLLVPLVLAWGIWFYLFVYRPYAFDAGGFWGFQAGPREMISYFIQHADMYEEFGIRRPFNYPSIFLDFYIRDPSLRQRAFEEGLDKLDPSRCQLLGIAKEEFDAMEQKQDFAVRHIVKYLNGEDAFYLVEYVGQNSACLTGLARPD